MSNQTPDSAYPGERLGRPEDGPGSVAGWGRRIVALAVDWVACSAVAAILVGRKAVGDPSLELLTPHAVFLVEAAILTALVGGSFGQLVLRIRVVSTTGETLGLLQALVRSLLILLVIPPLVFNRDNRGLHDLAAKSVPVRV